MPDPTPLEMIYDKLKSLEEGVNRKLDQVISCQIDLKLQDEIIKSKVSHLELHQLHIAEDLEQHKSDMEKHYNPYYSETVAQKLWRKKPEIATGGGLGALIVLVLKFVLENYYG